MTPQFIQDKISNARTSIKACRGEKSYGTPEQVRDIEEECIALIREANLLFFELRGYDS